MAIKRLKDVRQQITFTYEHEDGTVQEILHYYPGAIDRDAPIYYEEDGITKRRELLGEWFDRVAPNTFTDEDGNIITAVRFAELYPDNLFLMRAAQVQILEDHNPLLKARRL